MSHRAGTGFDQQAVGMAVVTAGELDDFVAAGKSPRQTDGAHAGFRAGTDQPHAIH
jgi:hypothetical protein